ncbi:hypothetical protein QI202_00360 [Staphylococcus saprophyticus]|nr:hypothetical protein [Staphylococcus saprophyticus]MDW4150235.1 hypothetical protein [Staphylococcus saprophyticus]MDW4264036.1 hypothetical protein [Staphylococcus saprophyticus]
MSNGTTTKDNSINLHSKDILNNSGEMPSMKFNFDSTDFSSSRIEVPDFNTSNISLSGNLLPYYTVMYSLHRVNSKEA